MFDLRKGVDHGRLFHHNGDVSKIKFHDNFLLTAAEDGNLCVIKASKTFDVLKTLHGKHAEDSGGIADFDVHPSGKLAISCGKRDRKLVTWNLLKGRSAFVTNLGPLKSAHFVRINASHYFVGFDNRVDVYDFAKAKVVYAFDSPRVNDVAFFTDDLFIVAADKKDIEVHSIKAKAKVWAFEAHETRVRCLQLVASEFLISASNDGFVKVWRLSENEAKLMAEHDTKCRITCLAVNNVPEDSNVQASKDISVEDVEDVKEEDEAPKKKKKKRVSLQDPEEVKERPKKKAAKLIEVQEDSSKVGLKVKGRKKSNK